MMIAQETLLGHMDREKLTKLKRTELVKVIQTAINTRAINRLHPRHPLRILDWQPNGFQAYAALETTEAPKRNWSEFRKTEANTFNDLFHRFQRIDQDCGEKGRTDKRCRICNKYTSEALNYHTAIECTELRIWRRDQIRKAHKHLTSQYQEGWPVHNQNFGQEVLRILDTWLTTRPKDITEDDNQDLWRIICGADSIHEDRRIHLDVRTHRLKYTGLGHSGF